MIPWICDRRDPALSPKDRECNKASTLSWQNSSLWSFYLLPASSDRSRRTSEQLRKLAHPARFELTTSAFGGQFHRFASVCSNLIGIA